MLNDYVILMDLNGRTFIPMERKMETHRTESLRREAKSDRMTGDAKREKGGEKE